MSLAKGASVARTDGEAVFPSSASIALPETPGSVVRTVLVHITEAQAVKIFAPKPNMPHDEALRQIKNVLLKRATLLGYKCSCDTVTGLQIEGLPGSEYTQAGEDSHYYILGQGESNTPHHIFEVPLPFCAQGNIGLGLQWIQQYPDFNKNNIREEKVMRLNGADYFFVHEGHPVINLLHHNRGNYGLAMVPRDRVNTDWYRVDTETFHDACQTLSTDVFDNTPHIFDLSMIAVRMRRPNNERWMDAPLFLSHIQDQKLKETKYKEYTETPITVLARIQLEYIPCAK